MECRRSAALTRPVIGPKLKISARPPARACRLSPVTRLSCMLQCVYRCTAGIHWMTLRRHVTPRYIFWRPPARTRLSPVRLSSA